jgi:hypothetical protein
MSMLKRGTVLDPGEILQGLGIDPKNHKVVQLLSNQLAETVQYAAEFSSIDTMGRRIAYARH